MVENPRFLISYFISEAQIFSHVIALESSAEVFFFISVGIKKNNQHLNDSN